MVRQKTLHLEAMNVSCNGEIWTVPSVTLRIIREFTPDGEGHYAPSNASWRIDADLSPGMFFTIPDDLEFDSGPYSGSCFRDAEGFIGVGPLIGFDLDQEFRQAF